MPPLHPHDAHVRAGANAARTTCRDKKGGYWVGMAGTQGTPLRAAATAHSRRDATGGAAPLATLVHHNTVRMDHVPPAPRRRPAWCAPAEDAMVLPKAPWGNTSRRRTAGRTGSQCGATTVRDTRTGYGGGVEKGGWCCALPQGWAGQKETVHATPASHLEPKCQEMDTESGDDVIKT